MSRRSSGIQLEREELREIFNLVDKDHSGTITKNELSDLLDTLGIDTSFEGNSTVSNDAVLNTRHY
jgi:calmodulin